jgi:hypothetical protein
MKPWKVIKFVIMKKIENIWIDEWSFFAFKVWPTLKYGQSLVVWPCYTFDNIAIQKKILHIGNSYFPTIVE